MGLLLHKAIVNDHTRLRFISYIIFSFGEIKIYFQWDYFLHTQHEIAFDELCVFKDEAQA